MKIKEISKFQRPVEKGLMYGFDKLSEVELLAIIINTGIEDYSAIDIATFLYTKYHSTYEILSLSIDELRKNIGISKGNAIKLKAIYELFVKMNYYKLKNEFIIKEAKDVFEHYRLITNNLEKEYIFALYLNAKNIVIKDELLNKGKDISVSIDAKEICKIAMNNNAKKVIIVHNHPSGKSDPSIEDKITTSNLINILNVVNVRLLDHIIVGKNEFYSFKDNKKYNN